MGLPTLRLPIYRHKFSEWYSGKEEVLSGPLIRSRLLVPDRRSVVGNVRPFGLTMGVRLRRHDLLKTRAGDGRGHRGGRDVALSWPQGQQTLDLDRH
jgi:hypothetical protein